MGMACYIERIVNDACGYVFSRILDIQEAVLDCSVYELLCCSLLLGLSFRIYIDDWELGNGRHVANPISSRDLFKLSQRQSQP
jgi:hypothetical protein